MRKKVHEEQIVGFIMLAEVFYGLHPPKNPVHDNLKKLPGHLECR